MDDNSERPLLDCPACSDKLPLVLSGEGVEPVIQVPASINQYLRNYQRDGVRFLYKKFKDGEGGILADDMGLGKTIQSIAFIAAVLLMKGTKEDKLRHCSQYIRNDIAPGVEIPSVSPVLIICPASLTDNWIDELQTWGYFKVLKITASNRSDLVSRAKNKECDVLITTFETARSIVDLLNTVDWTCVLVDEVHRIKDVASQTTKALSSLRCKLRYGLTGTPFQNNLKEVWCLLNWSNPQQICNLSSYTKDISRLIERGSRSSATKRDSTESQQARLRLRSLQEKFMKRRTKEILIKHLPAKTDQVVFCELTPVQKNIYRMITQSADVKELLGLWEDNGSRKISNKKSGLLFIYIHLLQKTANHVGLLATGSSRVSNKTSQEVCVKALKDFAGVEGLPPKKWIETLSDVNMSGKMMVLSKLLPAFIDKGDKILIFSYSTKLLDLIQRHLSKERYKHCRLDGTTPADTRFAMVRSFNRSPDPSIFLLSTKAGGVGLNITGANVVIIFDPNWNPAYDLQAQDRAHRLGQQREVRVYRLLSTCTIEEFVYLRQVYKQQLGSRSMTNKNTRRYFNSVSGDPKYYGELFGVHNLLSFRETGSGLTEEVLQKHEQREEKLLSKLEGKAGEEIPRAFISTCAIENGQKQTGGAMSKKSGLAQICEEVLGSTCDQIDGDDSEEWFDGIEEEEPERDDDSKNNDIHSLLERTSNVTNIVEHQEIVGPSTVEDFVTDCAIRDVLQKGINSQLPAFECSFSTENEGVVKNIKERCSSSVSVKFRSQFLEISKGELLSPYELATKIMSMTNQAKAKLLKKYQKRQNEADIVNSDTTKRIRLQSDNLKKPNSHASTSSSRSWKSHNNIAPSQTVTEEVLDQKDNFVEAQNSGIKSNEDSVVIGSNICKPNNSDVEMHNSTDEVETSSSFEKEVSACCPNLSKDAVMLMQSLICNKKKVEVPKQQMVTKAPESPKKCGEMSEERQLSPIVDKSTGCSMESVSLIDSLFSSSAKKLPSPKKCVRASLPENFGESHLEVNDVTSPSANCLPNTVLNATILQNLSDSGRPTKDLPKYRIEDDVFNKLLRSGKLKRV